VAPLSSSMRSLVVPWADLKVNGMCSAFWLLMYMVWGYSACAHAWVLFVVLSPGVNFWLIAHRHSFGSAQI
jgi:hypothetical protein